MIVAFDGKSFDTVDGQEQPHAGSSRVPCEEDRSGLDRWADDGAAGRSPATVLKDIVRRLKEGGGLLRKQPLPRQVEKKIKSTRPIEYPVQPQPRQTAVKSVRQAAAKAQEEYYRNAWENT